MWEQIRCHLFSQQLITPPPQRPPPLPQVKRSATIFGKWSPKFKLQKAFKFQVRTKTDNPETIGTRMSQTQGITMDDNIKAQFTKEKCESRMGGEKCQRKPLYNDFILAVHVAFKPSRQSLSKREDDENVNRNGHIMWPANEKTWQTLTFSTARTFFSKMNLQPKPTQLRNM